MSLTLITRSHSKQRASSLKLPSRTGGPSMVFEREIMQLSTATSPFQVPTHNIAITHCDNDSNDHHHDLRISEGTCNYTNVALDLYQLLPSNQAIKAIIKTRTVTSPLLQLQPHPSTINHLQKSLITRLFPQQSEARKHLLHNNKKNTTGNTRQRTIIEAVAGARKDRSAHSSSIWLADGLLDCFWIVCMHPPGGSIAPFLPLPRETGISL